MARILFPGVFETFSTSINKIRLDAQISDTPQDNTNSTPTAPPHQQSLHNSHPLSLISQNYRNILAITDHTSEGSNFPRSQISHISLHQPKIDDTYELTVEQPHIINEPIDWIPQPFLLLSIKPPAPLLPLFPLRSHLFPLYHFFSNSPLMDSDDSTQTVFNTISKFNKSDVETPDEFFDSKPSPANYFNHLSNPLFLNLKEISP